MIEFAADSTTSAEGFRAYFQAGGDGTYCGMMVPASVTDESFDTITAYRGACPAGFEGPLGGECWPTSTTTTYDLGALLSSSNARLALLSYQIVGVLPGNKISHWSMFSEGTTVLQPSLAVENGIQYVRFEGSNSQSLTGGPVALNFQSAGQRQRLCLTCCYDMALLTTFCPSLYARWPHCDRPHQIFWDTKCLGTADGFWR